MLTLPIKVQSKYIKHFKRGRKREKRKREREKRERRLILKLYQFYCQKKKKLGMKSRWDEIFVPKEKGRKEKDKERREEKR